ncbi:hypothetical protein BH11VER1_BH11VER1_01140 [soil metagenome]
MQFFTTVCTIALLSVTLFTLSSCVVPSPLYDGGYSGHGNHDYDHYGPSRYDGGHHDYNHYGSSHYDGGHHDYDHHDGGYHY